MHRRIAFVRSAGAAISAGIVGRATTCTQQQSEDEMKGLVQVSGLKPAWYADMQRSNVDTVVKLMAFSNGALKRDPPDGATLGTMFAGLRTGSACSGDDAWPADADAGAVTAARVQLALLCRYAQPLYDKAVERDLRDAGLLRGTPVEKDEEVMKDAESRANKLWDEASVTFNRAWPEQRRAIARAVMRTHLAFKNGQVRVEPLESGAYGAGNVIARAQTAQVGEGNALTIGDGADTVPMTRLATVLKQINRVLDSFVPAGHFEVDPAKQCLAGSHGRVDVSTAKPRQLMVSLDSIETTKDAYIGLSGVLAPRGLADHFTRLFLPRLGDAMTEGHSPASGMVNLVTAAGWMTPEAQVQLALGAPQASPRLTMGTHDLEFEEEAGTKRKAPGGARQENFKDKYERQCAHTDRVSKELLAKIERLEAQGQARRPAEDRRREEEEPPREPSRVRYAEYRR